jgi:hypothetical protein
MCSEDGPGMPISRRLRRRWEKGLDQGLGLLKCDRMHGLEHILLPMDQAFSLFAMNVYFSKILKF